jgi:hypothetical protein
MKKENYSKTIDIPDTFKSFMLFQRWLNLTLFFTPKHLSPLIRQTALFFCFWDKFLRTQHSLKLV